ncbi:hypothetical protein EPD60_12420 [Flaviaesturariibacter flavus]|uniref:Uncharacterized protein n=1 Tax=Flaviaesturariibacter flavus TaxID=2502780 RepID=A0A4R1B9K0_9BACT|nr:hypothetical protein [Flaviaesturariibacter flavus]TCJ13596.1 hypothetical protein EPD60_12420 [Flaviaesturariibacter flavus]
MRLLFSILTFLCVHLLGVPVHAYAGSRASEVRTGKAVTHIINTTKAQADIATAEEPGEEFARFDSAEDPDDDDDPITRRQLQLADYVPDDSRALILSCLSSTYEQSFIISRQPLFFGTAIYIAQRVLRL